MNDCIKISIYFAIVITWISMLALAEPDLVFVHTTDVHLCDEEFKNSYYGAAKDIDPVALFDQAVAEIIEINPNFVIDTGDCVANADKRNASSSKELYDLYTSAIEAFGRAGIPIYHAVGNHDVVGVNDKKADINESGYGKGLFLETFGLNSTYYSFDLNDYHFVVLDPNNIDPEDNKGLIYDVNDEQLSWLSSDLSNITGSVIVFLHEPTYNLVNMEELHDVLKTADAKMIFSGHRHEDEVLDSYGIPEAVGGAISASWWQGPIKDGSSEGYRVVAITDSRIDTFYKVVGTDKQINLAEPLDPIVNGKVDLRALIWSNSTVTGASYRIDQGDYHSMDLVPEGVWYAATESFDSSELEQGYHTLEIEAIDDDGTFAQKFSFKVSDEEISDIGDVLSHINTYMGKYVTVKGIITAPFKYTPVIQDDTAGIHLFAECYQPPAFNMGEIWTIRGKVTAYNNLTELKLHYAKDAVKNDEKGEMPKPTLRTAFEINESAEGLLVEVKNSTITSIDSGGFTIQDETGEVYVFGKEAGFNTSSLRDGYIVDIIGIGQQYKDMYEVTLINSSDITIHYGS
jgi:DNA/RNA endonuclease YhcR with UshA esterase domain